MIMKPMTDEKEGAWEAELERRAEEMESGAVEGVSWEDLRERLRRGVEKTAAVRPSDA